MFFTLWLHHIDCVDDFKSEDVFFPPRSTFQWLPSSIDKPECDDDQEGFVDLWVVAQTFHLEREHVMKMCLHQCSVSVEDHGVG